MRRHRLAALAALALLPADVPAAAGPSVHPAPGADTRHERPEKPVAERISGRTFPSVFMAWNSADNLPGESRLAVAARHDLMWHDADWYGLVWDREPIGLAGGFTPQSVTAARARRSELLRRNPNLILIAEIRYRDAADGFLPADHPWWARDDKGARKEGWEEGGFFLLDVRSPDFRTHVARQAGAVVATGAVDGILLDWWQDDEERLTLVKEIRAVLGDVPLVLGNANDRTTPQTAPYLNGYFMECYRSGTPEDWRRIAQTVTWAETNLRPPRVVCVETWFHGSRRDFNLMRAVTTLVLTHSDGYCLFSDPNPLPSPDHRHDWYPFWEKSLGRPTGTMTSGPDGTHRREYEKGTVVYNPMGNAAVDVVFHDLRKSLATGSVSRTHVVKGTDGDIFLKVN